jgi:hypothetical protein
MSSKTKGTTALVVWAVTALALAAVVFAEADAAEVPSEGEAPAFNASMSPEQLAREKPSAISLRLGFKVAPKEGKIPGLSAIRFGISRRVSFHHSGLSACSLETLFSEYAGEACASSLVGRGLVVSEVTLPDQEPVTVHGIAKAYYSFDKKQPRILVRVATKEPLPLIYVIPLEIESTTHNYATNIGVARMWAMQGVCQRNHPGCFGPHDHHPYRLIGIYSHISEFQLNLHRRFWQGGRHESFVSAECAVARGQKEATFSLATMNLSYPEQTFTGSQSARCEPRD